MNVGALQCHASVLLVGKNVAILCEFVKILSEVVTVKKKTSSNRNTELQLLIAITIQLTSNVTCMVRYNHSKGYMRECEFL